MKAKWTQENGCRCNLAATKWCHHHCRHTSTPQLMCEKYTKTTKLLLLLSRMKESPMYTNLTSDSAVEGKYNTGEGNMVSTRRLGCGTCHFYRVRSYVDFALPLSRCRELWSFERRVFDIFLWDERYLFTRILHDIWCHLLEVRMFARCAICHHLLSKEKGEQNYHSVLITWFNTPMQQAPHYLSYCYCIILHMHL